MSNHDQGGHNQTHTSDYEKFRMARLGESSDYENRSAHFSNQLSTRTHNEADWEFLPKRTGDPRRR